MTEITEEMVKLAHEAYAKTTGGILRGHPMHNALTAAFASMPSQGGEWVMADLVEVMAEVTYEADPRSGHWAEWSELDSSDPTRSEFIRASSKALSALDAAGYAVVPKEMVGALRGLLRSEYESEEPGLCDCIDNSGTPYQSQYLADQITMAEAALAQVKP